MRRRYVYDPSLVRDDGTLGGLVEVSNDFAQGPRTHFVQTDTEGYLSHSGLWVEGNKQRREDLARMGCRPWEGMEQEQKEAARQRAYEEQKSDSKLDESARRAYYQIDPSKRRLLERG